MNYVRTAQNNKSVTFKCVSNCFSFVVYARLAGRSFQNYEKLSFFSIFSDLGSFPQVFRHVKERLILESYETVTVKHVAACPTVPIFCFMMKLGREEC